MQAAELRRREDSGVYQLQQRSDDWIRDRGSERIHRACNSLHMSTRAIDHLVLHEWLSATMPGWIPERGFRFVPVPKSQQAGVGSHGSEWIPVHHPAGGGWVVRVDHAPDEALAVWRKARDDHRGPKLGCVVSTAFPSLTEHVAVAEVHPPRWRVTGASESPPLAVLLADPPVDQLNSMLASASQPDASRTLHELGIRRSIVADPLFAGTWHVNHLGQVLFPYRDATRLVGLQSEMAGRVAGDTGDWADESLGATHGIWHSKPTAKDTQLVVTTRAIDALSYHQLRPGFNRRYLAVSPMPGKEQAMLLTRAVAQMPAGSSVIAACSHSLTTEYLIAVLRRVTRATSLTLFQDSPAAPPDRWEAPGWNDVLRSVL